MVESPSRAVLASDEVRNPLHEGLLGKSPAIREVCDMLERLAVSDLTVLITGESGTGKDIAARLLHRRSPRSEKPFIKVNCPAIPASVIESELFGYERGAFTGARSSKPGRIELANHGTIFLDEIAETPVDLQAKLMQLLDGEPVMRIGGTEPIHTDVRIIAATNMSLEEAVEEGRVRQDIYFRLSEVIVRMPALRERAEDIPLLAEHFNYNYCVRFNKNYSPIPADTMRAMQQRRWRGNVRELGARVKKYVATGNVDALLREDDGPEAIGVAAPPSVDTPPSPASVVEPPPPERPFPSLKEAVRQAVEETETALIGQALQRTLWNRRKAAKLLGISYSSLLRRIDAYGIGKSKPE